MPPNAAAVAAVALLGSLLTSSGFVGAPSLAPRGQGFHSRRAPHFYTTPASARQQPSPPQCFAARQLICRASRSPASTLTTLSAVGDMDGIDPLEAGPDIDPLEAGPDAIESAQEDGDAPSAKAPSALKTPKARGGQQPAEDGADKVALAALAAAKDTAAKQSKKKKRKRADPFMPKGSVAPIEWQDFTPLEEGCRAHLVIVHTGLPDDQSVATGIINRVKERFGGLVNVHQEVDQDEEVTEEDRRKSNAFEIWLEGPEIIVYHARGECEMDITEEIIADMLDDIDERVQDEAILGLYCSQRMMFRLAGLTPKEQKSKQFFPL